MLLTLAVALFQAMPTQTPGTPPAGVYSVVMCSQPCSVGDSVQALIAGLLVLDTARSHSPRPIHRHGACFDFRRTERSATYAGLASRGYSSWEFAGDSIRFETYRWPDAWQVVRARLTSRGFEGRGTWFSSGVPDESLGHEYVYGEWLGSPRLEACSIARDDKRDKWLAPVVMGILVLSAILIGGAH